MRLSSQLPVPALALALILIPCPAPAQTAGGPSAPAAPSVPATPADDPEGKAVQVAVADLSSLNRLLPVGKTARKVTVPTVDEEGRLTSLVTMGSITRLDEETFLLKKVVLTSFERVAGEPAGTVPDQTVITLIDGRYHTPTRVLVSDRRVTIRKPTLFMSGDSLHYDSAAGRALMKGKSTTLITDAPRLQPDPAAAEPDEEEATDDDDDAFDDEKKAPVDRPTTPEAATPQPAATPQ